ncbi:DNA-binding protein [Ignicoccus pacificus DSM 13166]|uniref:DNA-binding protein n=1 Tax=Ignicoccus pacificus DSM 13166 TaxID=940294 RepID=A0A977PK43_9CREN|nr:DNA-binding protein [Ignicoccus pacificus DSM 13166]
MSVEPLEDVETPVMLLSIKPKYAQRILSGYKKFELRTWIGLDFYPGMLVVMYVSGNVKSIVGEFRVGKVYKGRPEYVWGRLIEEGGEERTGVGDEDYLYIARARKAMAIEVLEPKKYKRPVKLEELRLIIPGWLPPMSHAFMGPGDPLWEMVIKKLREL